MKAYSTTVVFILTAFVFILSIISCSPKCVVRGRVVDAETRQPIKGAAVAIKWYTDNRGQQSGETETVDAMQALSKDNRSINLLFVYGCKMRSGIRFRVEGGK